MLRDQVESESKKTDSDPHHWTKVVNKKILVQNQGTQFSRYFFLKIMNNSLFNMKAMQTGSYKAEFRVGAGSGAKTF
jgi:hypothetical protein